MKEKMGKKNLKKSSPGETSKVKPTSPGEASKIKSSTAAVSKKVTEVDLFSAPSSSSTSKAK